MNGPNNSIGWCDYTWNPVHGCPGNEESDCQKYCYGYAMDRAFGRSYIPTFYPERLKEPYEKEPAKIFVCSVSDICGPFFKEYWRRQIFTNMLAANWHTYQLLTKWPENIPVIIPTKPPKIFPLNWWWGTTVTKASEVHRIHKLLRRPSFICGVKFISFEPLLEDIEICLAGLDWIIIGPLKRGGHMTEPDHSWVKYLVEEAQANNIPVYLKKGVDWKEDLKQFPKEGKLPNANTGSNVCKRGGCLVTRFRHT